MSNDAGTAATSPGPAEAGEVLRLPPATRTYLANPALAPVWDAVAERLERNGLRATGTVRVHMHPEGIDPLAGLLAASGKPVKVQAGGMGLQLEILDTALRRSAAGAGVVSVIGALRGAPLVDRVAARRQTALARGDLAARLDAALERAGLADATWVGEFVYGVRRSGVLTRAGHAAGDAVTEAGAVLAELAGTLRPDRDDTVAGEAMWELGELASRCTGDAHGLDEGRPVAALVLRAAAAAFDIPVPATAARRRELWARLGVTPDLVSGTVLVWGLRPPGEDPWSRMMRDRADLGVVTHLTLQELRGPAAGLRLVPEQKLVSVCENPQVLQAASRAGADGPLVCTSGNPANAGWSLVRRMLQTGAPVRYHGDFDWPGVAIAGRLFRAGARPWRMGAGDYRAAVTALPADSRLALHGAPVATPWERRLAVEMAAEQVAVHEESVLETILADLI